MGVDLLAFPLAVLAQERKVEILAQETGAESACRVLDRSGRSCVLTAHLSCVVEDIAITRIKSNSRANLPVGFSNFIGIFFCHHIILKYMKS